MPSNKLYVTIRNANNEQETLVYHIQTDNKLSDVIEEIKEELREDQTFIRASYKKD